MKVIALILLCLALSCCQNKITIPQEDYPIHIQMNRFLEPDGYITKLSQVAEKIEYVVLESNPEGLIAAGQGVQPTQDGYLLTYKDAIYHFAKNGEYLSKIDHKGKGPGEYLRMLYQYYHDVENGIVGIPDCRKSINFYNYEGQHLNSIQCENQQGMDWSACLQGGDVFIGPIMLAYPMFTTLSKSGDVINEFDPGPCVRNWTSDINGYMYMPRLWVTEHPDGVLAHEWDTTWLVTNAQTVKPYFVIDPFKSEKEDVIITAPIQYLNENYIGFNSGNFNILSLRDKKYYVIEGIGKESLTDDIHEGLPFRLKQSYGGKIYDTMDAIDLLQPDYPDFHPDKKLAKIIQKLDEGDNPVLRIVTLRNEFIID